MLKRKLIRTVWHDKTLRGKVIATGTRRQIGFLNLNNYHETAIVVNNVQAACQSLHDIAVISQKTALIWFGLQWTVKGCLALVVVFLLAVVPVLALLWPSLLHGRLKIHLVPSVVCFLSVLFLPFTSHLCFYFHIFYSFSSTNECPLAFVQTFIRFICFPRYPTIPSSYLGHQPPPLPPHLFVSVPLLPLFLLSVVKKNKKKNNTKQPPLASFLLMIFFSFLRKFTK